MHQAVGELVADKDAGMIGICHAGIIALCPFYNDIGSVLQMKIEKTLIQVNAFLFQATHFNFDRSLAEFLDPFSVDLFKRIPAANDHSWYFLFEDKVCARRGLSMMGTGFKGDIEG